VRVVRVGVADTVDDRHLAIVPEWLEGFHSGVEAKAVVDVQYLFLGDAHGATVVVVERVAVRHDRVERVVATGELQNHENRLLLTGHS
jgi:hypothetical protein